MPDLGEILSKSRQHRTHLFELLSLLLLGQRLELLGRLFKVGVATLGRVVRSEGLVPEQLCVPRSRVSDVESGRSEQSEGNSLPHSEHFKLCATRRMMSTVSTVVMTGCPTNSSEPFSSHLCFFAGDGTFTTFLDLGPKLFRLVGVLLEVVEAVFSQTSVSPTCRLEAR